MTTPLHPTTRAPFRVTGRGPVRVLLLHALTGSPDAADRPGVKGWWGPMFRPGAPLAGDAATVWTPNLPGSCYGAPDPGWPGTGGTPTTRAQAEILAAWLERADLRFDLLAGGSLGGMVALELALLAPDRFAAVGVVGCGGRADAWLWGTNEVQRAILRSPALADDEAIALARRAAMLTFRSPASLDGRFAGADQVRDWLRHHGQALAGRFTRRSYLALLDAMDGHDLGRGRGGLARALAGLGAPLHILGIESDLLFPRTALEELAAAAGTAGRLGGLDWIRGPHGHDSFLIEWDQVAAWLEPLLMQAHYWKEAANS